MKKQIDKVVLTNYKGHEKFEAELNGNCAIVIGKNGVGKTSVIEAIKRCLGMKVDKPTIPIRKGETKASITVHIHDNGTQYVSEESYTAKDSKGRLKFYKLTDGYRDELNPAMDRLKEIVGNPLDLSGLIDMNGKAQFEFFVNEVKNFADLSTFEHEYENLYSDRRQINQHLTRAKARLIAPELRIVDADKKTYVKEKSAQELYAKKRDASELFAEKEKAAAHNQKVDDAEKGIKGFEEQIKQLQKRIDEGNKWLKSNPKISVDAIVSGITEIEEHNNDVDREISEVSDWNMNVKKVKDFIAAENEVKELEEKSTKLTTAMGQTKDKVYKAIKEIPFGTLVEGLEMRYELDEESGKAKEIGLYLDGLPFNRTQQSYGKMLKALVILAGYFNPDKLNFISIGDYSLLDKDNQKEVWQFIRDNQDLNLQVIAEKVDESKQIVTEIIEL